MNSRDALQPIFNESIAECAFPGGVVWLAHGEDVAHEAFGTTAYENVISRPVALDTIYDIASLSKLFTASAFIIALRRTNTDVNTPLAHFLPEFDTDDKRAITLRQLLNHTNGIGFHIQRLIDEPVETWIGRIASEPLRTAPGEEVHYTCTSHFLLGRVLERLVEQSLNTFIENEIIQPLGMKRTTFWPLETFALDDIAPAEIYEDRDEPWHGVVHDEAARAWSEQTGTACGNAGVFSTASDLGRFAGMWVEEGAFESKQIIHPDDVRRALTDTVPEESYQRGWSWQINAAFICSEAAPPGTAGHTGFTGPTMCLNLHTQHAIVILENRVYPTRNGPNRLPYHRRISEWWFNRDDE